MALEFGPRAGRTVLVRREHRGPLAVQRPFHPGDGVCHVYLLHPPGGVAGGDGIDVAVTARTGSAALVTTPAATKVYRTSGPASDIVQRLTAEPDSSLEWLPQETILFGGSRCRLRSDVRLAAGARFAGWEVFALGREHAGDHYRAGAFEQVTEIRVGGALRIREAHDFRAGDPVLAAPWGLASNRAFGTLYAAPADADTLARARREIAAAGAAASVDAAATLLDGVLAVKAVGASAAGVRAVLAGAWGGVRPLVIGAPPEAPRIWAT